MASTPITDGANWELLAPIHIQAQPDSSYKSGYRPIPPRYITISDTNVVVIEMHSNTAKPHWWLAGSVNRLVDTAIAPIIINLPVEVSLQRKIKLNQQVHLYYPDDGAAIWTLKVQTAHYLQDISIYCWLYRGSERYNNVLDGGGFEPAPDGQIYDGGTF